MNTIDDNSSQGLNAQGVVILKELSDIKSALSVNTNETANIKQRVTELQVDIKEMRSEVITRREFNESMKPRDEEANIYYKKIDKLWDWRWMVMGALAALSFLFSYISKSIFQ